MFWDETSAVTTVQVLYDLSVVNIFPKSRKEKSQKVNKTEM